VKRGKLESDRKFRVQESESKQPCSQVCPHPSVKLCADRLNITERACLSEHYKEIQTWSWRNSCL